jgi:nicotinamide riboside transporter PnuC
VLEFVTFLLAVLGYAGLTFTAVAAAWNRFPVTLWRGVAAIIVVHVLLIWSVRYEWQFAEATRNGYAGFVLFHGALLAIVASLMVRESIARWLVWAAFLVVSAGALGAVFIYEEVALYRIPVVVFAIAGSGGLLWAVVHQARSATAARRMAG